MMRYVSKFFLEILPSVIATVVGAYIVNHYINPKNATDTPKAAVYSNASPANGSQANGSQAKAGEPTGAIDVTSKNGAAKPQEAKAQPSDDVASGKPAEMTKEASKETKPTPEAKRPSLRERLLARPTKAAPEKALAEKALPEKTLPEKPLPESASASVSAAPVQTLEEHRDAAELARAAIERLRSSDQANRQVERPSQDPALVTVRQQPQQQPYEAPRATVTPTPVVQPSVVEPLPPPVNVTAAVGEGASAGVQSNQVRLNEGGARKGEGNRPVPPADIPSPARDIQAIATPPQKPSVADDMLTAARSVIHAVVPQ